MNPLVYHLGTSTSPPSQPSPPPSNTEPLPSIPSLALPHVLKFLFPHEIPKITPVSRQWEQGVLAAKTPSCGPKHDNLSSIRIAVPRSIASVPPYFGFTDTQIKRLLKPETIALWQQICNSEKSTPGIGVGMASLYLLQECVEKDILEAPLPLTDPQRQMLTGLAGKTLIVRSSSNEDTNVVNAGGNESIKDVAATEEDIKKALAKVIASYFSHKSFKNRSAFENPFKEMPPCSALVMQQIVETDENPIVSGVMITHKAAWFRQIEERVPHIVASWGFGAGTSGKTITDEWLLTKNRCYPKIRQKTHRIGQNGQVANSPTQKESACLTEAQLKRLQVAGCYLEDFFQKSMDVEFVFQGNELYIVQAREARAPEMKNPTFLDRSKIPAFVPQFLGESLIPGLSQVRTLPTKNVLFARDLEDADNSYIPGKHKAVVVYTPPASSNTHEEMNFSSQKPHPVPCFLLPLEAWTLCKSYNNKTLQLCPQTGLIVVADNLPIRKGLFLHPARFSISVDGPQGDSTHPRIEKLRQLLTATADELPSRFSEIKEEFTDFFSDISRRTAAKHFQQVSQRLHEIAMDQFGAMEEAAKNNQPTLLTFHAGVLRELLHNVSGLEAATNLPTFLELFLKNHKDPLFCQLAILTKKAWDRRVMVKCLAFLKKNYNEALLAKLQELDSLGMLPLWLTIHFSGEEPKMEQLLAQESGGKELMEFTREWRHLKERTDNVQTVAELNATWETLQHQTAAFLAFCSQFPNHDLLQSLQLSRVSYDLIQLWDAQIKLVKTSNLLPSTESDAMFHARIDLFARFGLSAIENHAFAAKSFRAELEDVLRRCSTLQNPRGSSNRQFSVQHWIVPRSGSAAPIRCDEERFTVIHQNLLRASASDFTEDHLELLPQTLRDAVFTFQMHATTEAKRFSGDSATIISILDDSASVTINVPLNLHSFVITIQQTRGNDNSVEFNAYWKGSDNNQGDHLEFIQQLSSIAGFTVKSYLQKNADLQVILKTETEAQIDLVCRMFDRINFMSLHRCNLNYFEALVALLKPIKEDATEEELLAGEMEARSRVRNILWKQFTETETVPDFIKTRMTENFNRKFLIDNGHFPMVSARVIEEVEGKRPASLYSKNFFGMVLDSLPDDQEIELLFCAAKNGLKWSFSIPKATEEAILTRLYHEAPKQVLKYFSLRSREMPKFKSLMETMAAAGGPTSPEQVKLHSCFAQLEKLGKDGLGGAYMLLRSWETQ